MSRESSYHYIHYLKSHHADLLEEFNRPPHLSPEMIHVPPENQPPNPEDEDDVVPDQHAAFGITQATQAKREIIWKDLGLGRLVDGGPTSGEGGSGTSGGSKALGQASAVKAAKMGVGVGSAGKILGRLPR